MPGQSWDHNGVGPLRSHYRATPGPIVLPAWEESGSPTTPTSSSLPGLAFSSVSSVSSSSSSSYSLISPVTPRTLANTPESHVLSKASGKRKGKNIASAMDIADMFRLPPAPEEPRSPTENPFAFDDDSIRSPCQSPSLDSHLDPGPASRFSSSSSDGSSLETPTAAGSSSQRRSSRSSTQLINFTDPPRQRKHTMPVEITGSPDPSAEGSTTRRVEVRIADINTVELRWTPGDAEWLVPARAYISQRRIILDCHAATPHEERKWLIASAVKLYRPMRYNRAQAESVLRVSLPGLRVELDTPIPPIPSGMRRSTFTNRDTAADPHPPDLDLRLIVSEPYLNRFRLSCRLSGPGSHEDVWIPAGVEFDVANDKVSSTSPPGVAGSATLQRMLMLALRRAVGTTRRLGIDVQRAVARADLRRLSFDPREVHAKPRGYGIVDLTIPGVPDGVRLYLTAEGNILEHACTEPGWRVAELELLATELLGVYVDTGPAQDPTPTSSLPQLRCGFERTPLTHATADDA